MEIVPDDMSDKEVREEVNYRTHRAGYTTRDGRSIPLKIQTTVPCGKVKLNIWPRDKNGRLIDD